MAQNKFIPDGHTKLRNTFRVVGPLFLLVGITCLIISFKTTFMDPFSEQDLFWLGFVGMPIIFVGGVLSMSGYGGAVARYQSREMAPVAKDTFNYLAGETEEGVEQVARAVQKGRMSAGTIDTQRPLVQAVECKNCHELNRIEAKFCNECGSVL